MKINLVRKLKDNASLSAIQTRYPKRVIDSQYVEISKSSLLSPKANKRILLEKASQVSIIKHQRAQNKVQSTLS